MPGRECSVAVIVVTVLVGCGRSGPPVGGSFPIPLPNIRPQVSALPRPLPPQTINGGGLVPPPGPKDAQSVSIHELLRRCKFDEARQMLDQDPEMYTYRHSQTGPLLFSVLGRNGNVLAKTMLERGADPNAMTFFGWTPLCSCVQLAGDCEPERFGGGQRDYVGAVELLLTHGAVIERARFPLNLTAGIVAPGRPTESLLEGGERFQRSKHLHSIQRSAVLALLRDRLDLPVDAMLPLNANSLYMENANSR